MYLWPNAKAITAIALTINLAGCAGQLRCEWLTKEEQDREIVNTAIKTAIQEYVEGLEDEKTINE